MVELGVCASVGNAAKALAGGVPPGLSFIEEHVQNFLVPGKGEDDFAPGLEAARASALPVRAANCFLPGGMKCVGPAVDAAAILAWAGTAFERASRAGVGAIVFGSGGARRVPEGFERERALDQFVALLKELGPVARGHGVTVVVEPLNRAECNLLNSVDEGARVVERAGDPGVMLLADVYHMLRDGEAPQSIARAGAFLRHVHVAERERRTAPGVEGDDLVPYLGELARAGYSGGISIESRWGDFASELPAAVAALRSQAEAAGLEVRV